MRILQAKEKRPLDLLAVSSGGHVAAACSLFGVRGDVDVWEIASGQLIFTHPGGKQRVVSLAFTPDGKRLIRSEMDKGIIASWVAGPSIAGIITDLREPEFAVSPDGNRLVVASRYGPFGSVECWALSDQQFNKLWTISSNEVHWPSAPAFSADGMRVAVGATNMSNHIAAEFHIRDATDGKVLLSIRGDSAEPPKQLAFSANRSKLLARSSGRIVKVFDTVTGQAVGELVHPGRPYVSGMAVHPNGTVACSRNNGTVCFWDIEKGKLIRTLDWKLGKLVSVAFAPDGSIGAAGTEDGQVVVWDVDE
jgi:WD40 repeat protein